MSIRHLTAPRRRCRCSPFAHKETEERLKSLPKVTEVAEMLSEAGAVWLKHLHSSLYSWPNLAQIRLLGTQGWHVSMCAWPKGPNLEPRDHFYNLCILLVEIFPPRDLNTNTPPRDTCTGGSYPLGPSESNRKAGLSVVTRQNCSRGEASGRHEPCPREANILGDFIFNLASASAQENSKIWELSSLRVRAPGAITSSDPR